MLKVSAVALLVGVFTGLASALFLALLGVATENFAAYPYLLFGLPLVGGLIGWIYTRCGSDVAAGNNLLLDEIHEPRAPVPFVMAPLILFSTVGTHAFGGSAGREGTAVQMGGAIADVFVRPLSLGDEERKLLLMAGLAAGFGAVFGTPCAGAIFGIEVLAIGALRFGGLFPCLVASFVGDWACRAVGIHHFEYPTVLPVWSPWLLLLCLPFALAATGFTWAVHTVKSFAEKLTVPSWVRPVIGGVVVIAMTLAVGTRDYNGLSLGLIERAFEPGGVAPWAFLLKLLFTAVTLGFGFRGGEVTPLFCIGATLGSAIAMVTHQDPVFFAALGFCAVFAGAANVPVCCAALAAELFGPAMFLPALLVCFLTYWLTGHRGIYASQRVAHVKPRVKKRFAQKRESGL
jgi:H+/Cl- antiporter ClcA